MMRLLDGSKSHFRYWDKTGYLVGIISHLQTSITEPLPRSAHTADSSRTRSRISNKKRKGRNARYYLAIAPFYFGKRRTSSGIAKSARPKQPVGKPQANDPDHRAGAR